MLKIKPGRRYFVIMALCGFLLCLAVLFNPFAWIADIISVARIRRELPQAMERWDSQGISGYQLHVKGAVPLVCILDGEMTVKDGQLVQVRLRENAFVPDTPLRIIDPGDWDAYGCAFQDLTVEAMFERIESTLQEVGLFGTPLTVHFDDAAGYITSYRLGRASRGGVLEPNVSECCTWFEFSNLNVLAP